MPKIKFHWWWTDIHSIRITFPRLQNMKRYLSEFWMQNCLSLKNGLFCWVKHTYPCHRNTFITVTACIYKTDTWSMCHAACFCKSAERLFWAILDNVTIYSWGQPTFDHEIFLKLFFLEMKDQSFIQRFMNIAWTSLGGKEALRD